VLVDGSEELVEKVWIEDAGRASAEIDGVDSFREMSADRFGVGARDSELFAEAVDVGGVVGGGVGVGGKVAEGALGSAERDGEVEAEGVHGFILTE
jgi:hypothetical protein